MIITKPTSTNTDARTSTLADYDIVVSTTSDTDTVDNVPESKLFSFRVYNPTRYCRTDPSSIITPVIVFFGGGCWPDIPGTTHIVVVKAQSEWENGFCKV